MSENDADISPPPDLPIQSGPCLVDLIDPLDTSGYVIGDGLQGASVITGVDPYPGSVYLCEFDNIGPAGSASQGYVAVYVTEAGQTTSLEQLYESLTRSEESTTVFDAEADSFHACSQPSDDPTLAWCDRAERFGDTVFGVLAIGETSDLADEILDVVREPLASAFEVSVG